MPEYQLEIKQLVDYPRCRIYREFVQALIADSRIRTNGGGRFLLYCPLLLRQLPYLIPPTGWYQLHDLSG